MPWAIGLLKVSNDDDVEELTRTASLQRILPEETTLAELAKKSVDCLGLAHVRASEKGPTQWM